jgi:hypothetical protein
MNQELMDMAKEAGLIGMRPHLDGIYIEALEAFAKLVAAAEREKVAREWECWNGFDKHTIEAFIRARGETK